MKKLQENRLHEKMKAKSKKLNPSRIIPLSNNRLARSVVTLGYDVKALDSAAKLKEDLPELKIRLGGKAAGLAVMAKLRVPVPPAFNLSTALCQIYLMRQNLPEVVLKNSKLALEGMQRALGKKFGSADQPLLVSVRSGAPISMPGMMDTILNLGLTTDITRALAKKNPEQARFWWDCYRRLITMFADVVLGLDRHRFDSALDNQKKSESVKDDSQLSAQSLEGLCLENLDSIRSSGKDFPQDPWQQLVLSIEAVFRSWNTERAVHYRQLNGIPEDWGTSVTVQAMVFGNRNELSGTGVVFTRDPSVGTKKIYGEYLMNAQGEDVVAGTRTPHPIEHLNKQLPKTYKELTVVLNKLETHFNDVQDVEFTIENKKLFILQTRSAKRTAVAAIENAVQFVKEKRLKEADAMSRISYEQIDQILHPSLKPTDEVPMGRGLPASPGAASGRIALDPEQAVQYARAGEAVILVRRETSPEDIMGMAASNGILTATGGMTSHAAVVGRGMGKACVVGCNELQISEADRSIRLGGFSLKEGDTITINGGAGTVYRGVLPTQALSWTPAAQKFFGWADKFSRLKVLANADTPDQARLSRELGATGIGLCRTEHMFFESERLREFRKMILAHVEADRRRVVEKLAGHQVFDFARILEAMKSLSVCIRLLDPPLHEFLPSEHDEDELVEIASSLSISMNQLKERMQALQEVNPMLGHRGCRLGITHPDVYEMQVKAMALAMKENFEKGIKTKLKIMIPLVSDAKELNYLLKRLQKSFESCLDVVDSAHRKDILKHTKWGTMIELPRACVTAGEIGKDVDFISFGTNDLTQTTFGLSRDDSAKFLGLYKELKIIQIDPFESLDVAGVGALIQMAVARAKAVNPDIEIGVCGEHGGDPSSIEFFNAESFDTISCSPFRVPIARLAAARAQLIQLNSKSKKSKTKKAGRR